MMKHLAAAMQSISRRVLPPTRLVQTIIMLQALVVPSQPSTCHSLVGQLQAELAHHNRLAVLPTLLTSLPLTSGPRRCKSLSATVMHWPCSAGL